MHRLPLCRIASKASSFLRRDVCALKSRSCPQSSVRAAGDLHVLVFKIMIKKKVTSAAMVGCGTNHPRWLEGIYNCANKIQSLIEKQHPISSLYFSDNYFSR